RLLGLPPIALSAPSLETLTGSKVDMPRNRRSLTTVRVSRVIAGGAPWRSPPTTGNPRLPTTWDGSRNLGAGSERAEIEASSQSGPRAIVYELDTLQPKAEGFLVAIPLIHLRLTRLRTGDHC